MASRRSKSLAPRLSPAATRTALLRLLDLCCTPAPSAGRGARCRPSTRILPYSPDSVLRKKAALKVIRDFKDFFPTPGSHE